MSRRCPKKGHLFLNWLRTNRHRFQFAPSVVRHHKNCIELQLIGINSAILPMFHPKSGILINVRWQGICWDLIGDFDVAERKSDVGYYCNLCKPEYKVFYPTREELWVTHGFETFLEWCNTNLADANWLELFDGDGVTSAMLHKEKPEDDQHWEPLIELVDKLIPLGKKEPKNRTREIRKFVVPLHNSRSERS